MRSVCQTAWLSRWRRALCNRAQYRSAVGPLQIHLLQPVHGASAFKPANISFSLSNVALPKKHSSFILLSDWGSMLKGDSQSLERFKKLTVETVTLSAAGLDVHLSFILCQSQKSGIFKKIKKKKEKKKDLTEQKSTAGYSTVFVKSCSTCCWHAARVRHLHKKGKNNSWNPADAENISCQKIPKYRIR